MKRVARLVLRELAVQSDDVLLMRAKLEALKTQLPLLYAMLVTNAVALICTHVSIAPLAVTFGTPGVLVPVCLARARFWSRVDVDTLCEARLRELLRQLLIFVFILGTTFSIWAETLLSYGSLLQQTHVLFFMAITGVGCVFCLAYIRAAALLLSAIVVPICVVSALHSGEPVLTAIAVNLLVVVSIMVAMIMAYSENFRRLVQRTSELRLLGDEHERAALEDPLTSLANRSSFFQDCRHAMATVRAGGEPFILGLLDLDGFKPINDVYGYQSGDLVLREVARRLRDEFGDSLRVARMGGDEFALIVAQSEAPQDVTELGKAICDAMARPIALENRSVRVGASIGFACYADPSDTLEHLIETADFALFHAKEWARGTAVIFSEQHAREIGHRRRLEHALRSADLEAEMWVAFQPIVDTDDGRVIGFEALARWTNPILGSVSPGAFIPMAERLGLIGELTDVLFAKACAVARGWPEGVGLSFNLSAEDVAQLDSGDRLAAMVAASGLAPARLTFEITETAVMRNFDQAEAVLERLRACGTRIALDDFGTGYSSLGYVNRLPLDKLKVDQSFVRSLGHEPKSRSIVETIHDLGENLGLQCIVEGVETEDQVAILRGIGFRAMQGYHFGRPLPAKAVATLLDRETADCAA